MKDNTAKKGKYRWPLTIGLILGTVVIVLFAFYYNLPTVYKHEADSLYQDSPQPDKKLISVASLNKEENSPYLKTGLNDVFFTIDTSGKIAFFEYKSDKFVKMKSSSELNISLPVYNTEVEITIATVQKDGKTEGYGLYADPKSTECPYVFVKLTDNKISGDFDYIVYSDNSISDLYKNNKDWQMAYSLKSGDKAAEKLFSDKGAPAGLSGLTSDGFILIPGDFAGQSADAFYFLSDRSYENGKMFDLYKKDSANAKEKIAVKGISAPFLFSHENGIYFLIAEADSVDSFGLYKLTGSEPTEVRRFSGTPEQYIADGNYIFSPSLKTLYDLFGANDKGLNVSISISGVQDFAVNGDGTKLALAGNFAGNSEKLLFYNLSSNKSKILDSANLFVSGNSNIMFLDDSVYFLAPAAAQDRITNFIISWDAIFSLK